MAAASAAGWLVSRVENTLAARGGRMCRLPALGDAGDVVVHAQAGAFIGYQIQDGFFLLSALLCFFSFQKRCSVETSYVTVLKSVGRVWVVRV